MTTIADKLALLATTKAEIEEAIEQKGVDVPEGLPFAGYPDKIRAIGSGGSSGDWEPHPDWIDISTVADNEINLLTSDGGIALAFAVAVANSGTYSIDWGDGSVETGIASGTNKQHQYTIGAGKAVNGGQYTVFKVRIYGASDNITSFKVARHTLSSREQWSPLLWVVFGATAITDYANTFYNATGRVVYCRELQAVVIASFANASSCSNMFTSCLSLSQVTLPASWGNVTTLGYMFYTCLSLSQVTLPTSWGNVTSCQAMFSSCLSLSQVILPASWGNVINCSGMFSGCYPLSQVTLPTSWGNVMTCSGMFSSCSSLSQVTLPTLWGSVIICSNLFNTCHSLSQVILPASWESVTDCSNMFTSCYALSQVTLPASWGDIVSCNSMFLYCFSLRNIDNLNYIGNITQQCDMASLLRDCEVLSGTITIASLLSSIGIYGAAGNLLKLTGIRLTNGGSTFTGSSPQVNVSYTSLDAAALNTLFGDLPTLSGKTINIIGCTGAASCDRSIATAKGWTVTG